MGIKVREKWLGLSLKLCMVELEVTEEISPRESQEGGSGHLHQLLSRGQSMRP